MFFTHVTINLNHGISDIATCYHATSDPLLKKLCACLSLGKQNCRFLKVRSTFGCIMFCGIKTVVFDYLEMYQSVNF